MRTHGAALDGQAWVVALMVFGSAVVLSSWTLDAFMLPKFTLVALGAVALVGAWIWRLGRTWKVSLPWSGPTLGLAAFVLAAFLATVSSELPWMSLYGAGDRYAGLVAYLSYGVLFLSVVSGITHAKARLWTRTALAAAVPCLLLGYVQAAGGRPFRFLDIGLPGAFSSFGNVNFAGAWSGMLAALLLATALDSSENRNWRLYATAVLPFDLVYAYLTSTSQAVVVSFVALAFAIVVLASSCLRERSRRRPIALIGIAAALVAGGMLVLSWGRVVGALDQALVERPYFWAAAFRIWLDNPLLGTGLDTFGQHFLEYRSASHAGVEGAGTADAPHSVPIAMLSNGGLLLALSYAAFVIAVGVVLVRGVGAAAPEVRPFLAGWGGVWVGYQLQSLVSFDVPPLAVLHFAAAGVIVGLAGVTRWREIDLAEVGGLPGKQLRSAQVRHRVKRRTMHSAAVVTAILLGWVVLYPYRADLEATEAVPLSNAGQYSEAAAHFRRAAQLNPAEGSYLVLAAQGEAGAGRMEEALRLTQEAARREPGTVQYSLFAGRIAQELGRPQVAAKWYRKAVATDPFRVEVLNEVAEFHLARGEKRIAETYLRRALRVEPDDAKASRLLAALG